MSVRDGSSDGSDDPEGTESSADAGDADAGDTAAKPTGKRPRRRSGAEDIAAETTGKSVATASRVENRTRKEAAPKQNIFKRLRRFFREVVAELRKVIWPNRKQMVTYTIVVVVFVTFMVAFISGLDLAFIKGVTWLFG